MVDLIAASESSVDSKKTKKKKKKKKKKVGAVATGTEGSAEEQKESNDDYAGCSPTTCQQIEGAGDGGMMGEPEESVGLWCRVGGDNDYSKHSIQKQNHMQRKQQHSQQQEQQQQQQQQRVELGLCELAGVWTCISCEYDNFSRRVNCHRCKSRRPSRPVGMKRQQQHDQSQRPQKQQLPPQPQSIVATANQSSAGWTCDACTFMNTTPLGSSCFVCNTIPFPKDTAAIPFPKDLHVVPTNSTVDARNGTCSDAGVELRESRLRAALARCCMAEESNSSEECPLCLEPLSDTATTLEPCKHVFCSECIHEWRYRAVDAMNFTCPMCRSGVKQAR
jgi:hypothetical protein